MKNMETMNRLHGLIFDVDGVIADTEPVNARVTIRVLKDMFGLKGVKPEDFEAGIGKGAEKYVQAGAEANGLMLTDEQIKDAANLREQYLVEAIRQEALPAFDGVLELINDALKRRDFRLAIATSASLELSRAILESAGEAILVCNNDGTIIRASHAVQELVRGYVLLKSFDDVFQIQVMPENRGETATPFSVFRVLKGETFRCKQVLFERDEGDLYFMLTATVLRMEKTVIGCVLVLTDITEIKRLEMIIGNFITIPLIIRPRLNRFKRAIRMLRKWWQVPPSPIPIQTRINAPEPAQG